MVIHIDPASTQPSGEECPAHINPILWQQSLGLARQIAARVFRDGGTPEDAVVAVGLPPSGDTMTWDKAVDVIAAELSRTGSPALRRAA
jgi:hypothetical protein